MKYSKTLIYNALIFILIFTCFSCSNEKTIKVNGKLVGANGAVIYLKVLSSQDVVTIDSTIINKEGRFELKGKTDKPGFYDLFLGKNNSATLIINPGEKLFVAGNAKDLPHTYAVKGSRDSELAREITFALNKTLAKIEDLRQIYLENAHSPNILEIRNKLDSTYNQIENSHRDYTIAFIRTNQHSLVSLMALYQQINPRRAVLNPNKDYEVFQLVDSVLTATIPKADAVQNLHITMKDIIQKRNETIEAEKRTALGAEAPEIALLSPKGETITLSSFRKKYVLLDFWASWCEPCRKESPNLVRNYWRYKNAGFEIFQVSLDKSKDSWIKAIQTDALYWSHASDLKMWDTPLVALYNIQGIPANFLIDPTGKIIAKNLRGNELAAKMKEIFKY